MIAMTSRHCWTLLVVFSLTPETSLAAPMPADGTQYVSRDTLISQLASETNLQPKLLQSILAKASFKPAIIKRMTTAWESQPYVKYRPLFMKKSMAEKGASFLATHHTVFDNIEQKYHVEREVIAAILGIETRFGERQGKRPILDSLYTLSTGYPRRADFFRRQLAAIIQVSRQDQLQLDTLKGSYAGAFGAIQFIPTSFRDYAVDEDQNGRRDPFNSPEDIIGSVANYFQKHGWQYGKPIAHWLPINTTLSTTWERYDHGKLQHWVPLAELRRNMSASLKNLPAQWRNEDLVSIISMKTAKGKQLALVQKNFQVIMRYNPSFNYAMAVTEIAAMWEREKFSVE